MKTKTTQNTKNQQVTELETEFLSKLNKLTYVGTEGSKELITKEGYRVSYSAELSRFGKESGMDVTIHIHKDGKGIARWGCINNEEISILADWWSIHYRDASSVEFKESEKQRELDKLIWDNL